MYIFVRNLCNEYIGYRTSLWLKCRDRFRFKVFFWIFKHDYSLLPYENVPAHHHMNQRHVGRFCVKRGFECTVKILDMQLNINKNEIVVEFKLWD